MAHFYAAIKGTRGEASRLGTKVSGIRGTTTGWNAGVRVWGEHRNGKDHFEIYTTTGSNGNGGDVYIGEVIEGQGFVLSEDYRKKLYSEIRKQVLSEPGITDRMANY